MKRLSKVVDAVLGGTAGGFALVFILCAATGVIAILTGSSATLPGVFMATPGRENGALALEFRPNFVGIFAVVALMVLVSALVGLRRSDAAPGGPGRPS